MSSNFGSTRQCPGHGKYTGYNLHTTAGSRTALNEDLTRGSCLQLDWNNHGSNADGFELGVPTAGKRGRFGIVSFNTIAATLAASGNGVNYQAGSVANLRQGGTVDVVTTGRTRARVRGNCVAGETLLAPLTGALYLTPYVPDGVISAPLVAASTAVVNTVSTEQTFTGASAVIPAYSARVGDLYKFKVQGIVTAGGDAETLTVKLKIGSNIIFVTGAPDNPSNDIFVIEGWLQVRTIGASGTFVTGGLTFNGTPAAAASAADIPSGTFLGSTANDFTAATTITVTGTWSGTAGNNSARVDIFNVEKSSSPSAVVGPWAGPVAVAASTFDTSTSTTAAGDIADASGDVVWIDLLQPPW